MLVDQTSITHLVGLSDDIIRFFIRGQIDGILLYGAIRIDDTVWRLDEAILVDLSISGQVGDQTDVRSFRRLDRTDTAIV